MCSGSTAGTTYSMGYRGRRRWKCIQVEKSVKNSTEILGMTDQEYEDWWARNHEDGWLLAANCVPCSEDLFWLGDSRHAPWLDEADMAEVSYEA